MKIAVISDSHYINESINNIKPYLKDVDMILHCGDGVDDLKALVDGGSVQGYGVRGNCDFSNQYPNERIVEILGIKIFMCHGHRYGVKGGYDRVFYKGREVGADIVLFGHSHIGVIEEEEGLILMNPGSISVTYASVPKSLGFIQIDNSGKFSAWLEKIDR